VGAADSSTQIIGAALKGDRILLLEHRMHSGVPLRHASNELVAACIEQLSGHNIMLEEAADWRALYESFCFSTTVANPAGESSMIKSATSSFIRD
jgi:spore cortex formation protein SpoVR/YcgB (stage V sporulation)